ncbi:MAG: hypothetical protein AAFN11_00350 [Chloroflexota bacterium]
MRRTLLRRLTLLWVILTIILSMSVWLAPTIPSRGTVFLMHNQFLNQQERFELVDLSRNIAHEFTPAITEDARYASLAPDNRRMVTIHIDEGIFTLRLQQLDGTALLTPMQTTPPEQMRLGSWSQDGRYLIYYIVQLDGNSNTHIWDTHTGESTRIEANIARIVAASLSPNNTQIAFSGVSDAGLLQVWAGDWQTQSYRLITDPDATSDHYCPAWSPDSTQIAYWASLDYGSEQLMVTNADGTGEASLLSEYVWRITTCPQWSADGKRVVFVNLPSFSREAEVIIVDLVSDEYAWVLRVEETTRIRWVR